MSENRKTEIPELSVQHSTKKRKKKKKQRQSKQEESRRKEIIKISTAINELENKVIIQNIVRLKLVL
jgi:hypothetical protein